MTGTTILHTHPADSSGNATGHDHDHVAPTGHPHSGQSRKQPPVKKNRGSQMVIWAVLAAGLAAGGLWWWLAESEEPQPAQHTSAELMAQMRSATQGWVEGGNVFGGKLLSEETNGHHVITVTDIPNKPCVESGWALAREGQVTVNNVFLPRISAGKLAELCSSGDNKSTIIWMPK